MILFSACKEVNNDRGLEKSKQKQESIMEGKDFKTIIWVEQDAATAFKAIQNFRGWWSLSIEGHTDRLNEVFLYHYKDVHICKIKLVEAVADKRLVYQVLDNHFNFTKDKTEWIDTRIVFDISKEGNKTKIEFTHEGLVPEYECYDVCHDAWTSYIQGSLYYLITTGKGNPNPEEGGLNAELVEKWGLPKK